MHYKNLKERFRTDIDVNVLETPLLPRQSENAFWLLDQRYLLERYDHKLGTTRKENSFEEFARRVSRIIASAESLYVKDPEVGFIRTLEKNLFNDVLSLRFLFNSPCLFGAGAGLTVLPEFSDLIYRSPDQMTYNDYRTLINAKTESQQLFACFVIDVPDSIEGIFSSVKDAAVISKYGGGVGGNFGSLREAGSEIKGGIGGKASGPVSFMETWNTMGAVVVQGGRRRAALMGMLPDNHPDIEAFMDAKVEEGKLPYFNISVCVSDALVTLAETEGDFQLISRATKEVKRTINAKTLWDKLCHNAWKRGDPGVFFIDRANADNILKLDPQWKIESTNPCGEQPLPNYTSCNLGSINLAAFVVPDGTGHKVFDWQGFADQVYRSMTYLDLVIDACSYPLEKIGERTKQIRPVGLGLMGLADAAINLGEIYGSDPFNDFCTCLSEVMSSSALLATIDIVSDLQKDPFPESHLVSKLLEQEKFAMGGDLFNDQWLQDMTENDFEELIQNIKTRDQIPYTLLNTLEKLPLVLTLLGLQNQKTPILKKTIKALMDGKLRNSRRLSIAPTGSISMLIDSSAGIEPNFAWSWNRKVMNSDDSGYEVREFFHPLVGQPEREQLRNHGKITDPRFVTAYDISTDSHVQVTGIFAKYIDSGISKTVNLPSSATVEDVKKVYQMCYNMGCKGITIYRDGSRLDQPIEVKTQPKAEQKSPDPSSQADAPHERGTEPSLPSPHTSAVKSRSTTVITGKTIKDRTPWGSLFVTLNYDGGQPFEVFASLGKSGSELKSMTEALSRVISIGLRSGGKLEDFVSTLRGLSGREYWMFDCDDDEIVRSIPDAVALLLDKISKDDAGGARNNRKDSKVCPECNAPMEMVSGCEYCFSCGYSPCK